MPFGYFGAKHGMAKQYPPPIFDTVIEPFAGAAGYACYWARMGVVKHAILFDKNPAVIALWHRLQRMTVDDVMAIKTPEQGDDVFEPLIALASGEQGMAVLNGRGGKSRKATTRMINGWNGYLRRRLVATLPFIKSWDVIHGEFNRAKNSKVTWFIDPPYTDKQGMSGMTAGGHSYRSHFSGFDDHDQLATWCINRKGQVIVCEQDPANWLPFQYFRNQRNAVGAGTYAVRKELIYYQINGKQQRWDRAIVIPYKHNKE